MALRFVDGFDHYTGTGSVFIPKWSSDYGGSYPSISTTRTRFGSGSSMYFVNGTVWIRKLLDNQATWICGMAVYTNGVNGQNMDLFSWEDLYNGSYYTQQRLILGPSNVLRFYANGNPDQSATANPVPASTWTYIEMKVTFHNTAGAYEVRMNGNTILSGTNVNTRNGGSVNNWANMLRIGANAGSSVDFYFDDVYICDTSGTTNNDFLGNVRISTIMPTGAGTYAQFTQTGGTVGQPYTAVNEIPPDNDTSYISTNVPGNKHTFITGDISPGATIYGIQANITAKKDDAGPRIIAPYIVNGMTEGQSGSGVGLNDSYAPVPFIMETDPNTGAQWYAGNVNSSEFGVKLVT